MTRTGSVSSGRGTPAGRPRTRPPIGLGLAVPIGLVIAVTVAAVVAAVLLASRYRYGQVRQPPRPSGISRAVPASLASPTSLTTVPPGGLQRLALPPGLPAGPAESIIAYPELGVLAGRVTLTAVSVSPALRRGTGSRYGSPG